MACRGAKRCYDDDDDIVSIVDVVMIIFVTRGLMQRKMVVDTSYMSTLND